MTFASCQKNYTCTCDNKIVLEANGDTVKSTELKYSIRGTQDDAEGECKYYETYEDYLERPAVTYHYCGIEEED